MLPGVVSTAVITPCASSITKVTYPASGRVKYHDQVMATPGPIHQTAGSPVVLMLRPEEMRLGSAGGENQIDGLVKSVSFQGSVVRVRLSPNVSNNGHTELTLDLFNGIRWRPRNRRRVATWRCFIRRTGS